MAKLTPDFGHGPTTIDNADLVEGEGGGNGNAIDLRGGRNQLETEASVETPIEVTATTIMAVPDFEREAPNGEGRMMDIDPDAPWARWPTPESLPSKAHQMRFEVDRVYMPSGGERLILMDDKGPVGYPMAGAMVDLSTRIGYPWDFVQKLPLDMQADILNHRISEAKDMQMTMTRMPMMGPGPDGSLQPRPEGYRTVANVSPGWRGVLPHGVVAQTTLNILTDVYGVSGVNIAKATLTDKGMELRIQTDYSAEVSDGGRRLGDVVSLGIKVWHRYGMELGACLYIERLVCLNGMTTSRNGFEWKQSLGGDPQRQLDWLYVGVASALAAFDGVVEKARLMARTPVEGDAERLLVERARAMRIPRTHEEAILNAWRQEPVQTEWGFANAFTRFATHDDGLNDRQRTQFQAVAGQWAETFDLVNARLPRPLAIAVGASIYEGEGE